MSNNLPSHPDPDLPGAIATPGSPDVPFDIGGDADGTDLRRYVYAILRYKWLILGVILIGTAIGFFFAQRVRPTYVAQATIWIENAAGDGEQGPIQSAGLLQSSAWLELLKTYEVLDHVVREQRLYLDYANPADSVLFKDLEMGDRFRPGAYELSISDDGSRYELESAEGVVVETGAAGDSIGRSIGFSWRPGRGVLGRDRTSAFAVLTPRDAALHLRDKISATLPSRDGSFMLLELKGSNAQRITATLNATARRFVEVATELKRNNSAELTAILEEQMSRTAANLEQAEMDLEAFRVQTVTLPAEQSAPIAGGIEATRDPAFQSFFDMRIEREQLRRDREAIRTALAFGGEDGAAQTEQLWTVGTVQNSAELRQALNDLTTRQAELRTLRSRFTEQHPEVIRLAGEVRTLETVEIPRLANALLAQIQHREAALDGLIGSTTDELRQVPPRMIEEARLRRRYASAETIHLEVQSRYESARLAAVSSIPDVRILDEASLPHTPTNPTAKYMVLAMALFGSAGLAVGAAIVLDRIDPRFRYPTQITSEMGLPIIGAIQFATQKDGGSEAIEQVVEAFRELRLAVMHAYGSAGPIVLTVTSPGSGDGKSFVSSNLALAFADLGHKTLIIDGDIRRGTLHHVLGGTRKPGLTDLLAGEVAEEAVIQRTDHPNLTFIGAGGWRRSGPELLSSVPMRALIANARAKYKVIIVDSSPLGAGVDPYVLGTVTGNLLMVLRTGTTDRELAGAKLEVLQRLPIRILGAVMNAVPARGAYRYYSYLSNYQLPPGHEDREPAEAAPA